MAARNANEFREEVGASGTMELSATQAVQLCGEGGLLATGSAPAVPMLAAEATAATFEGGLQQPIGPQKVPAGEKKTKGKKAGGTTVLSAPMLQLPRPCPPRGPRSIDQL